MFRKIALENGLRVMTAPMQGTNTVTVLVLCGTGSDYESRELSGVSHFLEHLFFKGTTKRPGPHFIAEELDGMGSVSNAFTTHEFTGYFIKAGKSYLDRSLEVLADIYQNSLFVAEEIEKEKQVIVEEMHKDQDTPTIYIGWVWENLLYGDQPAGWDVIGREETVRGFRRDDFANYFFHQYVASNTVVVIAGNIDEAAAVEKAKGLFGGVRHDPPVRGKPNLEESQTKPAVSVFTKKTDQTHIMIGFRGYDIRHPHRYAAELLGALLGSGMSSRMFMTIRERLGLAYTVWASHEAYSNRGYLATYAGADHGNTERVIRAALDEYAKIRNEKVSPAELLRIKDYVRGTTLMGLEASHAVANFVGVQEVLTGEPLTMDEVFAKIDAVTPDELTIVAHDIIRPERLNLALITPQEGEAPFIPMLQQFS